ARVIDRELEPLRVLHEPLRRRQDGAALAGELDAAPRALEKPHAERLLQHLDLLAERRLRHAEPLRRLAEVALLGHRQEIGEVSQQPEVDHATCFPYGHKWPCHMSKMRSTAPWRPFETNFISEREANRNGLGAAPGNDPARPRDQSRRPPAGDT